MQAMVLARTDWTGIVYFKDYLRLHLPDNFTEIQKETRDILDELNNHLYFIDFLDYLSYLQREFERSNQIEQVNQIKNIEKWFKEELLIHPVQREAYLQALKKYQVLFEGKDLVQEFLQAINRKTQLENRYEELLMTFLNCQRNAEKIPVLQHQINHLEQIYVLDGQYCYLTPLFEIFSDTYLTDIQLFQYCAPGHGSVYIYDRLMAIRIDCLAFIIPLNGMSELLQKMDGQEISMEFYAMILHGDYHQHYLIEENIPDVMYWPEVRRKNYSAQYYLDCQKVNEKLFQSWNIYSRPVKKVKQYRKITGEINRILWKYVAGYVANEQAKSKLQQIRTKYCDELIFLPYINEVDEANERLIRSVFQKRADDLYMFWYCLEWNMLLADAYDCLVEYANNNVKWILQTIDDFCNDLWTDED